jgi:beta-lactamase superfamily II metal-dependent hydrolase
MFRIDMLPATRGDALWIEYGSPRDPHRILIDGGIAATRRRLRERIEALPMAQRRFDLLVITHIDLDHIAGILGMLRDPPDGFSVDDVWFNGWEHLLAAEKTADDGILGAKLAERVTAWLRQGGYAWNTAFEGGPAAIPDAAPSLPSHQLRGGMTLTLLSPTYHRLRRLMPVWEKEIEKAKLKPGEAGEILEGIAHPEDADEGILGGRIDIEKLAATPFKDDTSHANASSIAVLAEFEGKRALLAGDAFASDLATTLRQTSGEEDGRIALDALKLSHHGGRKNTSPELLSMLECPRYLFSTSGSVYRHPHDESVARVVVHGAAAGAPQLLFNYRSEQNEVWDYRRLARRGHPYTVAYGAEGELSVEL